MNPLYNTEFVNSHSEENGILTFDLSKLKEYCSTHRCGPKSGFFVDKDPCPSWRDNNCMMILFLQEEGINDK